MLRKSARQKFFVQAAAQTPSEVFESIKTSESATSDSRRAAPSAH
jgi:hypothetical protein